MPIYLHTNSPRVRLSVYSYDYLIFISTLWLVQLYYFTEITELYFIMFYLRVNFSIFQIRTLPKIYIYRAILLTNCAQRRQGEKESVVVRPLVLVNFFVWPFVQNRFVTVHV